MKFSRLQSPDSFRPRPARGAEVASGFKDEEDEGVEFDPKRDLLKKDWEGMKGELEELRGTAWWSFSEMAMSLSLLFPDRKAELNLDDAAFGGIIGALEWSRGKKDWWSFSDIALNLSLLFPDRKADLNLNDEAFDGMKGELEVRRGNKGWGNFSFMAMRLSLLAAERAQITHDGQILITPKPPKLPGAPKPLPNRSLLS